MGRTAAQKRQRAEIASEEVHSQNNIVFPAFLLAAKGLPLPPIGRELAFRFCKRTKGSPG